MNRNKFTGVFKVIFCIALWLATGSCNDSSALDCSYAYNTSQAHFSTYYRTKDSSELKLALRSLDAAGPCREYRKRNNALKISILFLLQRYNAVAAFIDSTSAGDFAKPYQKQFSKNLALAKAFDQKKNLEKRNGLLQANLTLISRFIQATAPRLDTTAVYDYFYTESQFLPKAKYLADVDSAEKSRPADSALFSVFRRAFYPDSTRKQ